ASLLLLRRPQCSTLFPYTTLFRSFSLQVLYGDKIVFSFVGYQTQEYLSIEDKTDLLITLNEDNSTIDEVVVVGLGNVQRKISSRSEEHTSELQSRENLVCRLLLEK